MTIAQKVRKQIYPGIMAVGKWFKLNGKFYTNQNNLEPKVPIYTFYAYSNMGEPISFHEYKGKYLLIANTASDCGYTAQYAELQLLQDKYKGKLKVVAFPANDFGGQEPGADSEIANFCGVNFGVDFPLMMKSDVVGPQKNEIFDWLSSPDKNGWNSKEPNWNFCKYLVSPEGSLLGVFESAISPLSPEITEKVV
jgi:glutathione peroxidase